MFGLGVPEFIILAVVAVGGVAVGGAVARGVARSGQWDAEWAAEVRRRRELRGGDD